MMPGMDGWTVLTALKADPELADIPVVMVTMVDDRNLGYALGASDYLTKPVDRDQLAAVLRRVPVPAAALPGAGGGGRPPNARARRAHPGAGRLARDKAENGVEPWSACKPPVRTSSCSTS